MEEHILRSMRAMAWQRVKGELRSMLETYWGDDPKFSAMDKAIKDFIEDVEDNGKHE